MAVANPSVKSFDRLPPQNLDAERSVLGSMLLSNEVIDEVIDIIRPNHFYLDAHQRIARALFDLYENSMGGVDAVTLASELDRRNDLGEIGGASYIAELLESVPHAAHGRHYAQLVREKWVLRQLRETCRLILEDIEEEVENTHQILSHAEQRIFSILETKGSTDNLEIRDILMTTFDSINSRWQNEGKTIGLSTGYADLDQQINGLSPSELIILAARPSMGKTAFVCNLALEVARAARFEVEDHQPSEFVKKGVLLFSLEQSKLELSERFLCINGKLDGHRLKQGTLEPEEREQVQIAASELSELPILIDDYPGRTMAEIGAISRRLKRKHDISLIIIDYLQLIEPEDKKAPREQQVAQIARRLKFLAKEIDVPVIALAQLNRGVELREQKRPRLADLRESGAIEQDADLVWFLHRPEAYDPEDHPGMAELIVAKHRNGPTGIVNLTWLKESMRFVDYSGIEEPAGGYFSGDDSF